MTKKFLYEHEIHMMIDLLKGSFWNQNDEMSHALKPKNWILFYMFLFHL